LADRLVHERRLRTRSLLVRKRSSSIISARPITSNTRLAMLWIEADIATYLPSAQR